MNWEKISDNFSYLCTVFIFGAGLIGTIYYTSNMISRPAKIEIYTNPLIDFMCSDKSVDEWNITSCSIEGCGTVDVNHVSAKWHYWLFGIEQATYKLIAFVFFLGMGTCMLFEKIENSIKEKYKGVWE